MIVAPVRHAVAALLAVSLLLCGSVAAEEGEDLAKRLDREELALLKSRSDFQRDFQRAYKHYPRLPHGLLEAIAFVQTRWLHVAPEVDQAHAHQHMPQAHGVMGLYRGDGFSDQVGEAARLLGVDPETIITDPATNILAAAALLDQALGETTPRSLEDAAPALARYAGFGHAKGTIQTFARNSFAFDVLLALDRGVDDRGIVVPEREVRWEKAFDPELLVTLDAPFVRLDVDGDQIDTDHYRLDPIDQSLKKAPAAESSSDKAQILSTDYGPARWVASPYHSARSSYSSVTIHTAQGTYAGTIAWFQNNPYRVSAHYVIRSSDGQVTQMVRESRAGHHVGGHNSTTLGIEHEGYVNNSSWYTNAMYNASAALVRHFCARYGTISCTSAYNGPSHSGIVVLPTSVRIKGHQHYSGQTHTDPGINWNWPRYYSLLNPGSVGSTRILDSFESSVGHFTTSPAYSGSTVGIAASSTATRNCSVSRNGSCSLHVRLEDNPNSSANWAVRLLSGSGTPSNNVTLSRGNGRIGFWVWSGGSGMSVSVGVDDSDGTERGVLRPIPANQWTYVEWRLDDQLNWNAWVGGNGAITSTSVTLDAIWFFRAQTSYPVNLYIDDVQIRN
jgi:N-acetyl-anhydromuramyl-L-alanine amidase AmpD